MAKTKYGKYIIKEPIVKARSGPSIRLYSEKTGFNLPSEIDLACQEIPRMLLAKPHAHDFDQYIWFFGNNPLNIFDFGAEIEVTLGEEGEKHFVNTTTVIYLPAGLLHGPIEVKKVTHPFFFMHISHTPQYSRKGIGPLALHPDFRDYTEEEKIKLRKGII